MAKHLRYVPALALLAALAACGPSSPEEMLAEAREAAEAGELRTAEIHLKNLLQETPDDVEARRLLGEVSLAQGNAVGAEQELRRAASLGADAGAIELPLLRALLAQNKLDEVIERIEAGPSLSGQDRVAELGIAGAAYRGLGRLDEAERAYRDALERSPGSPELRTELARVLLQSERANEAMRLVGDVLAENPEFAPALLLRGAVEHRGRRYAAAEATFEAALDAVGGAGSQRALARAQLIEAQLAQGKLDDAAANADVLLEENPRAAVARYLKARVDYEQGNVDEAERRLEAVVADFPEYWQAYGLLGAINLEQERLGQARMNLRTAVNNRPQDAAARLRLAELYVREGDIDSAKQLMTGSDDTGAASDALFFALIGRASQASGEAERAAEYFEQSEQAGIASPDELVGLSSLYVEAGELERALRVLENADDDALTRYLTTLVRLRQGDAEGAAESARALSEAVPDAPWAWNLRGAVALGGGDVETAEAMFSRALELEPDNAQLLINAARASAVAGNAELTAERLNRVLEIEPDHAGAAFGLATLAAERGELDEARAWLERVPESPQRDRLGAELAMASGQHAEAADAFKRAFAAQPSAPLALRAYLAASRAGLPEPEAELERWVEDHPEDARSAFALSTIALPRGDEDEAIRRLEATLAAEPEHPGALNNLAYLYGERGDGASAEEMARRAYAVQPENAAIADTLGWILLRNGKAEEGLPLLAEAADALSDQPEVRYHYGAALAEAGDAAQALDVLRGVLDVAEEAAPWREDAEALVAGLEGR